MPEEITKILLTAPYGPDNGRNAFRDYDRIEIEVFRPCCPIDRANSCQGKNRKYFLGMTNFPGRVEITEPDEIFELLYTFLRQQKSVRSIES